MPGIRSTILVCDDETAIRSIVATKLRGAGFDVIEGRNGLEGYCWCDHSALPEGTPPKSPVPIVPALIVTDLQMPLLSGIDMAMKLKAHGPTSRVPVLMLTARGYIVEREQLLQTNIKALVPKPFGANQLLEQVRALLASSSEQPGLRMPESEGPRAEAA
jgi:two-component system chemotaxis response regulator CheY